MFMVSTFDSDLRSLVFLHDLCDDNPVFCTAPSRAMPFRSVFDAEAFIVMHDFPVGKYIITEVDKNDR